MNRILAVVGKWSRQRVSNVFAHPGLDRTDDVVGVGVRGRQRVRQRHRLRSGRRWQLEIPVQRLTPTFGQAIADRTLASEQLLVDPGPRRHDGIDRPCRHDPRCSERAVRAHPDVCVDDHTHGPSGVEDQIRHVDVEVVGLHELIDLDIAGETDVPDRRGDVDVRSALADPVILVGEPTAAIELGERLTTPIVGFGSPDPHHHVVAENSSNRRVHLLGESRVTAGLAGRRSRRGISVVAAISHRAVRSGDRTRNTDLIGVAEQGRQRQVRRSGRHRHDGQDRHRRRHPTSDAQGSGQSIGEVPPTGRTARLRRPRRSRRRYRRSTRQPRHSDAETHRPGQQPPDDPIVDPEPRRVHHDDRGDREPDANRPTIVRLEPVQHDQHHQHLWQRAPQVGQQLDQPAARHEDHRDRQQGPHGDHQAHRARGRPAARDRASTHHRTGTRSERSRDRDGRAVAERSRQHRQRHDRGRRGPPPGGDRATRFGLGRREPAAASRRRLRHAQFGQGRPASSGGRVADRHRWSGTDRNRDSDTGTQALFERPAHGTRLRIRIGSVGPRPHEETLGGIAVSIVHHQLTGPNGRCPVHEPFAVAFPPRPDTVDLTGDRTRGPSEVPVVRSRQSLDHDVAVVRTRCDEMLADDDLPTTAPPEQPERSRRSDTDVETIQSTPSLDDRRPVEAVFGRPTACDDLAIDEHIDPHRTRRAGRHRQLELFALRDHRRKSSGVDPHCPQRDHTGAEGCGEQHQTSGEHDDDRSGAGQACDRNATDPGHQQPDPTGGDSDGPAHVTRSGPAPVRGTRARPRARHEQNRLRRRR